MELNNLEATILRFLEAHQGKNFAISRKDLVEKINGEYLFTPCGYNEREIRRTIKHLREQHGESIGSAGKGYYMAMTPEEIKMISGYYKKRALSELYSAARIEKSNLPAMLGQLSLEIGG